VPTESIPIESIPDEPSETQSLLGEASKDQDSSYRTEINVHGQPKMSAQSRSDTDQPSVFSGESDNPYVRPSSGAYANTGLASQDRTVFTQRDNWGGELVLQNITDDSSAKDIADDSLQTSSADYSGTTTSLTPSANSTHNAVSEQSSASEETPIYNALFITLSVCALIVSAVAVAKKFMK
jgi:hypothetical protein